MIGSDKDDTFPSTTPSMEFGRALTILQAPGQGCMGYSCMADALRGSPTRSTQNFAADAVHFEWPRWAANGMG